MISPYFLFMSGVLLALSSQAGIHHPQSFLDNVAGARDEGAQIVQHYCASCHAPKPLIPVGAPRMQDRTDWAPRLKQGLDSLFKRADEGFNAMPPRGGCFECSDDQLYLAIKAMLAIPDQKSLFKTKKNPKKSIR